MKNILAAVVFTLSSSVFAGQANIDAIDQATNHVKISELQKLVNQTDGYDQAYGLYRLGAAYLVKQDIPKLIDSLSKSMEILESQLKNDPENVESMILLAQVLGLRMGFEQERAAEWGPRNYALLYKANQIAPNNPRLLLVQGIIKYHTPAVYGGNKELAVQHFSDAIRYFTSDEESGFHWGYEEAYVWRGLAKVEKGDTQSALEDFKQALAVNPDYQWAKGLIDQNTL